MIINEITYPQVTSGSNLKKDELGFPIVVNDLDVSDNSGAVSNFSKKPSNFSSLENPNKEFSFFVDNDSDLEYIRVKRNHYETIINENAELKARLNISENYINPGTYILDKPFSSSVVMPQDTYPEQYRLANDATYTDYQKLYNNLENIKQELKELLTFGFPYISPSFRAGFGGGFITSLNDPRSSASTVAENMNQKYGYGTEDFINFTRGDRNPSPFTDTGIWESGWEYNSDSQYINDTDMLLSDFSGPEQKPTTSGSKYYHNPYYTSNFHPELKRDGVILNDNAGYRFGFMYYYSIYRIKSLYKKLKSIEVNSSPTFVSPDRSLIFQSDTVNKFYLVSQSAKISFPENYTTYQTKIKSGSRMDDPGDGWIYIEYPVPTYNNIIQYVYVSNQNGLNIKELEAKTKAQLRTWPIALPPSSSIEWKYI